MTESITEHDNASCALCKGASENRADHYALGRLRLTAATKLGLTRERAMELPLEELMARWRAAWVS